jgi:hypothetical protein
MIINVNVGEKIGIGPHPSFNHGCMDYAVLRYDGDGKATVIAAQSCTSCWQVGHDDNHTFAQVGDVWDISGWNESIQPAGNDWATTVAWKYVY